MLIWSQPLQQPDLILQDGYDEEQCAWCIGEEEERIACLQSIGTPVGKVKVTALKADERTKLTEWATAGMTEQDIRDRFHRFWDLKDRKGKPDTFWQTQGVSLKAFCEHDEIGNAPTQPISFESRHHAKQTPLTDNDRQSIMSDIEALKKRFECDLELLTENNADIVMWADNPYTLNGLNTWVELYKDIEQGETAYARYSQAR